MFTGQLTRTKTGQGRKTSQAHQNESKSVIIAGAGRTGERSAWKNMRVIAAMGISRDGDPWTRGQ